MLGLVEPWRSLLDGRVTSLPYYRWVMGTLELDRSLVLTRTWLGYYAMVFIPLTVLAIVFRGAWVRWALPVAAIAAVAVSVAFPLDPSRATRLTAGSSPSECCNDTEPEIRHAPDRRILPDAGH